MDEHKKAQMIYFKISEMSETFQKFAKIHMTEDEVPELQLWQARAMLACAQQLSVLNVTLKKLVQASKSRDIGPDDMIYPGPAPDGE